ncbi:MCM3 factor, partial [Cercotrichas coryphoeus]|nr:MCM3 factor [Cercotrichas coryphoeus]
GRMAAPAGVLEDAELREAQRDYLDFLDDEEDQGIYQSKVRDMISDNQYRLVVNINDLRRKNEKRASRWVWGTWGTGPERGFKGPALVLQVICHKKAPNLVLCESQGFPTLTGKNSLPISYITLPSGSMKPFLLVLSLHALVPSSLVRPKVVRSVHYCPATKKTIERRYTDMTSLDAFPSSSIYPTKDEENNPLETEFGLSVYKDHQTITIQEMPEKAPAGQLPRSVDVVLDDDLVDRVKPGDRVQVVGTYRCLPGKKGGYTSGTFRTILIACHVKQMSKDVRPLYSASDVAKIKRFSKSRSKDIFDQLARSLAPSIHGHEYIKKAILCMLLGGVEKILENGSRIRGDINILLIGDPSVAKSQLLRYVLSTAPRAIPTTGRGSSGVGLTAAVTTDPETGERRLEAGAMVLADRGVVCIDEFDKMSDIDRTAIHEVMEQGRVTIAKAGIQARLNSRCSVLAAANPVYGRVSAARTLPWRGQDDGRRQLVNSKRSPRPVSWMPGTAKTLLVWCLLWSWLSQGREELLGFLALFWFCLGVGAAQEKVVSMEFMRKYIHVAKMIKPVLTEESASYIAEEYSRLRSQSQTNSDVARTSPITARTLETLIRLSTAHAKARMNKTVDLQDAEAALELVQFAYFKKVLEKEKKRRKPVEDDSETEKEEDQESQDKEERRTKRRKKARTEGEDGSYDPYDFSDAEEEMPQVQAHPPKTPEGSGADEGKKLELAEPRLKAFKAALLEVFKASHAQSVGLKSVMESINRDNPEPFSAAEVKLALAHMQDDNQVMVSDDIIFLI